MLVVAVLILYIEDDIQTAQYACGEAEDVDETKGLALGEVSPGKFQIVLEHTADFAAKIPKTMPFP
jgi:hypothetical protein